MPYISFAVKLEDSDERPRSGERVEARFTYQLQPATWSTEYTDGEGRAEFGEDHPGMPVEVTLYVQGEAHGPYDLDESDEFTIGI